MDVILVSIFTISCFLIFVSLEFEINPIYRLFNPKSNQEALPPQSIELYSKIILGYCQKKIGSGNKIPKVNLCYNKSDYLATYYYPNLQINLFVKNCKTIDDLIRAIIHEYGHYVQFLGMKKGEYSRIMKESNYNNHSWEIMSRQLAETHKEECLIYLKKILKQQ